MDHWIAFFGPGSRIPGEEQQSRLYDKKERDLDEQGMVFLSGGETSLRLDRSCAEGDVLICPGLSSGAGDGVALEYRFLGPDIDVQKIIEFGVSKPLILPLLSGERSCTPYLGKGTTPISSSLMLEIGGYGPDILVWTGSKNGQVSCSSAWNRKMKERSFNSSYSSQSGLSGKLEMNYFSTKNPLSKKL
ncbi:hypothetical protein QJS10_CPA07g00368 [Acorus calamus]|uniref:Uncharacterized protein n=1 Tax=Acorus calamus TaxID=4465 RepID=A0AAV9EFG8_ACOCL|nr:hypothetical protein QJS10_CPA07g00368 [Acorus calamus]